MSPLPTLRFVAQSPMPGDVAAQTAIREVAKDVASLARDVAAMRATSPLDRSMVVIVTTVGEYCTLKGLTLPASVRDCEGKRVATLWQVADVIERVGLVRPALKGWAASVAEAALTSTIVVLVVGVVFDATSAAVERVVIDMPAAASAAVVTR
jgi:hypothetical protein